MSSIRYYFTVACNAFNLFCKENAGAFESRHSLFFFSSSIFSVAGIPAACNDMDAICDMRFGAIECRVLSFRSKYARNIDSGVM